MNRWSMRQLTFGSEQSRFHSHSYYDIPVVDPAGRLVLAHRTDFIERDPLPDDAVALGIVDIDEPGSWRPVARTTAWSWQQGPMAQWIGDGSRFVFNDRGPEGFVARIVDASTLATTTVSRPIYAVAPDASFALSLNMARLNALRPGYGYAGGDGAGIDWRAPEDDGLWKVPLDEGRAELLLSVGDAVRFMKSRLTLRERLRHRLKGYSYWFNHVKISPSGDRFTMKLRWRQPGGPWNDRMGVSLTGSTYGGGLHLLADATSHVLWLNDGQLYFWRAPTLCLYDDDAPVGKMRETVARDLIDRNVHMRHLPPSSAERFGEVVFDTPYRENIDVVVLDVPSGQHETIATFTGHHPAAGRFRCDLHPCPTASGDRIVVTSMMDGGRQLYLLEREPTRPA